MAQTLPEGSFSMAAYCPGTRLKNRALAPSPRGKFVSIANIVDHKKQKTYQQIRPDSEVTEAGNESKRFGRIGHLRRNA